MGKGCGLLLLISTVPFARLPDGLHHYRAAILLWQQSSSSFNCQWFLSWMQMQSFSASVHTLELTFLGVWDISTYW